MIAEDGESSAQREKRVNSRRSAAEGGNALNDPKEEEDYGNGEGGEGEDDEIYM